MHARCHFSIIYSNILFQLRCRIFKMQAKRVCAVLIDHYWAIFLPTFLYHYSLPLNNVSVLAAYKLTCKFFYYTNTSVIVKLQFFNIYFNLSSVSQTMVIFLLLNFKVKFSHSQNQVVEILQESSLVLTD